MSRIIVSRNTWTLFTTTHVRAWSNATVFHNRFAHTFSKGDNDKVTQSSDPRANLQLEEVNQVEKAKNEFRKKSNGAVNRGEKQIFSIAAVEKKKAPVSPGPNKGRGSQHN